MTRTEFNNFITNICYSYSHPGNQFELEKESLWIELQKDRKSLQRRYQRQIKALKDDYIS